MSTTSMVADMKIPSRLLYSTDRPFPKPGASLLEVDADVTVVSMQLGQSEHTHGAGIMAKAGDTPGGTTDCIA